MFDDGQPSPVPPVLECGWSRRGRNARSGVAGAWRDAEPESVAQVRAGVRRPTSGCEYCLVWVYFTALNTRLENARVTALAALSSTDGSVPG